MNKSNFHNQKKRVLYESSANLLITRLNLVIYFM